MFFIRPDVCGNFLTMLCTLSNMGIMGAVKLTSFIKSVVICLTC